MDASPTVSEVLAEFLEKRDRPTQRRPYSVRRSIVELLERSMDSYAYQDLAPDEAEGWRLRWEKDQEANSFCRTFGPQRILPQVGPFLDWFIIRNVLGGPEIAESAGSVILERLEWLESSGDASGGALEDAKQRARVATDRLPRAERLSSILYDLTQSEPLGAIVEDRDIDYDTVTICRVESGLLWFTGPEGDEIGPLSVPQEASELARPGWEVSATHFVRTTRAWHLVELGNVYPR